MRILLACDRSGGHIFPALSLAEFYSRDRVHFFAPSIYFKPLLKKKSFIVYGRPLNLRNILLEGFFRFFEALFILLKSKPEKIIGFGGRDTFFLILLGKLLFIDTYLYEPNFTFGKANRILSLIVERVYCGFNPDIKFKKAKKVGIPIRENLQKINREEACRKIGLKATSPVILCFGGSQGSKFINDVFRKFVDVSDKDFQIIHITGTKDYCDFLRFYDKIDKKVRLYEFCYDMQFAYSCADLVISRCGALSLAEISFYGIAAVFIPYPGAGRHQYANARYAQLRGACELIQQDNFSFNNFKDTLESILSYSPRRKALGVNMLNLKLATENRKFCKSFNL